MKRAAIIYMLDTSGSTVESSHAAARRVVVTLEPWLKKRGAAYVERFLVFDALAHEIERDAFLSRQEMAGGTRVSPALARCAEIIEADYPATEWDVFAVLFWDGDNWSVDDNMECIQIVRHRLLPRVEAVGFAAFAPPSPDVARVELIKDVQRLLGSEARVVIGFLSEGNFALCFRERADSIAPTAPGQPAQVARRPVKPRRPKLKSASKRTHEPKQRKSTGKIRGGKKPSGTTNKRARTKGK